MRVITGTARGRKLSSPEGFSVRPTADRVKEAIFSMIQFELEQSRVLDLFAGSGQLGIEALSRGAKSAVFIDLDRDNAEIIKSNLKLTGLMKDAVVSVMNAADYLRTTRDAFDIVFVDPPYRSGLIEACMPLLVPKLSESAVVLCETDDKEKLPEIFGSFALKKRNRYGKTAIWVYRRIESDEQA